VSTGSDVRRSRVILVGLLMLLIASAARSYSRAPALPGDPAAALDANTSVPASVMSVLRRACFDCHSNETRWPWYSALPVASWLIEGDVSEGRAQLNFSRWTQYNRFDRADLLDKACEKVTAREMPMWQYRVLHPESRLTEVDVAALCAWGRQEAARLAGAGS
jgi:Haem-binding domain